MKGLVYSIKAVGCAAVCALVLSACSGDGIREKEQAVLRKEEEKAQEFQTGKLTQEVEAHRALAEVIRAAISENVVSEPEITEADWSDYFEGLNGAAVIYDASNRKYMIFNSELANLRRSPCSTFKIISSLIALENGIIRPEQSTHTWSGEVFWNENWNHDIDFEEAFRDSCVWYFREIIDEIGQEIMQEELNRLSYGNCDISDWEGRDNTNNNNRALTGFWIESSLAISPKEQTEVMERIFGANSVYRKETLRWLKQVMLAPEQNEKDITIYGKTGMGKMGGILADAWFTGFAESKKGNIYFCIYLGRTDNEDVSSAKAKEIALRLAPDYCRG